MAERFESMYDLPGSLEDQLDEVSRFVRELTLASPMQAPPIPQRNPARSPTAEMPDPLGATSITFSPPPLSPRRPSANASTSFSRHRAVSATSVTSGPPSSNASPLLTGDTDCWTTLSPRKRVSEFSFGGSSVRDSSGSYASSTSSVPSRASLTQHAFIPATESIGLPFTPELREIAPSDASSLTLLPPPAMRPASSRSEMEFGRGKSNAALSPFPARQDSITKLHRSSTTASQRAVFEKDAFRNSAVLCDV